MTIVHTLSGTRTSRLTKLGHESPSGKQRQTTKIKEPSNFWQISKATLLTRIIYYGASQWHDPWPQLLQTPSSPTHTARQLLDTHSSNSYRKRWEGSSQQYPNQSGTALVYGKAAPLPLCELESKA